MKNHTCPFSEAGSFKFGGAQPGACLCIPDDAWGSFRHVTAESERLPMP